MSFSNKGKDEYVNIEDLSELNSINDGDRFIVQSSDGETVLIDYASFKIDLDHTTFKTSYQEMIEFTAAASEFVDTITDEFTEIKDNFTSLKTDFDEIKGITEALRLWIRYIYLGFKSESALNNDLSSLSAIGQNMFREIKSEIDSIYNLDTGGEILYENSHLTRSISI